MADSYAESIRILAEAIPKQPRRELRCHPLVVEQLRWENQAFPVHRTPLSRWYDLMACPVTVDRTMAPGAWEIYEDGLLTAEGNTELRSWPES